MQVKSSELPTGLEYEEEQLPSEVVPGIKIVNRKLGPVRPTWERKFPEHIGCTLGESALDKRGVTFNTTEPQGR